MLLMTNYRQKIVVAPMTHTASVVVWSKVAHSEVMLQGSPIRFTVADGQNNDQDHTYNVVEIWSGCLVTFLGAVK